MKRAEQSLTDNGNEEKDETPQRRTHAEDAEQDTEAENPAEMQQTHIDSWDECSDKVPECPAPAVSARKTCWADLADSDSDSPREIRISAVNTVAAKPQEARTTTAHKAHASGKAGGKGNGKGAGKAAPNSGKGGSKRGKLQCQFIIGIEEDPAFKVVKQIIGHTKRIALSTDTKLRLRGRGSKFLEGPMMRESTEDLMLCVSGQDMAGFENAKQLISELLQNIYKDYEVFCSKAGKKAPALAIQLHEGYREGSR